MICSQRGGSFTVTADGTYTIDRFAHVVRGTFAGTYTHSTDSPDGFKNSLKVVPTSTYTPTASDNAIISHKIEGQNLQDLAFGTSSAKKITVSFYAKTGSTNNGDQFSFQLRAYTSADGAASKIQTRSFTATSSWQRFTFSFVGDTAYTIFNTNALGIDCMWHLAAGASDIQTAITSWTTSSSFTAVTGQSNFLDNTSNEFYLTGVQLEVDQTGSGVATDFEHRSFGQELALCQRYFYAYKPSSGMWRDGYYTSGIYVKGVVTFPVTMRSSPSVVKVGTLTHANNETNNVAAETPTTSVNEATSIVRGASDGRTYSYWSAYVNGVGFTFSSEL
tara:strand:- start:255 stop:1253 length:999 start_codon:yes stop_codon:yes gene_type:complete